MSSDWSWKPKVKTMLMAGTKLKRTDCQWACWIIAHVHRPWTLVIFLLWHLLSWFRFGSCICSCTPECGPGKVRRFRYFPVGSRSCRIQVFDDLGNRTAAPWHSIHSKTRQLFLYACKPRHWHITNTGLMWSQGSLADWRYRRLNCKNCATILLEVCQCQKRPSTVLFVGPPPRDLTNVW